MTFQLGVIILITSLKYCFVILISCFLYSVNNSVLRELIILFDEYAFFGKWQLITVIMVVLIVPCTGNLVNLRHFELFEGIIV